MALTLVTAPTTEPLTIAEVKGHLRLDSSSGEPAPTLITAALASPAVAGNVDNGAHRYLATFVTADGETEAGAVSAAVTVADKTVNGKVELTAIPLGGSAVTSRKIYRTAAGGSTYLLLTTIADNVTTVYTDNIADSSLGAAAPSTNTTADPELTAWLVAARQLCETFTHRAFITQTWDLKLNHWTCDSLYYDAESGGIRLPWAPTISVTSVTYVDGNGDSQTWAAGATGYLTDLPSGPYASRARVYPAYAISYPTLRTQPNAVTIRFVAGYGAAAAVPSGIKAAMKLLIAHWYEHREAVSVNVGNIADLPLGVTALLWPFKSF